MVMNFVSCVSVQRQVTIPPATAPIKKTPTNSAIIFRVGRMAKFILSRDLDIFHLHETAHPRIEIPALIAEIQAESHRRRNGQGGHGGQ